MVKEDRNTWKAQYFTNLIEKFEEYPKCFIVGVDNVRSKQMQQIRASLRGSAELMMGKNTMIRKVIRGRLQSQPQLEKLLPHIKENVGFVFTRESLSEIRERILENKVEAPAKAGALAPLDVRVPPQNTGLGPEKTSFFQALSIPTKITRGTIEILNEVHLIKVGDKVGASEATLLNMLKIYPFSYGLVLRMVYENGSVYEPAVLDMKPEDFVCNLQSAIKRVAAVSLAIDYTNTTSIPHTLIRSFKNCLAVSVMTDYTFPESERIKEYLADPSKFAAAAAPVEAAAASGGDAKKEEPEESEESDDDMGLGLFD